MCQGKWHLGGMAPLDIKARESSPNNSPAGPIEHGFQQYIAMMEGNTLSYFLKTYVLNIFFTFRYE